MWSHYCARAAVNGRTRTIRIHRPLSVSCELEWFNNSTIVDSEFGFETLDTIAHCHFKRHFDQTAPLTGLCLDKAMVDTEVEQMIK